MGFWQNVKKEIDFTGINRKELSIETEIPVQTINRAIERDSKIYLEDALKIARFFNKPIDYFLDSPVLLKSEINTPKEKLVEEEKQHLALYRKYHELIQYCESLPDYQQSTVRQLAQSLAESAPAYTSSK